jgi:hypothetical protein
VPLDRGETSLFLAQESRKEHCQNNLQS